MSSHDDQSSTRKTMRRADVLGRFNQVGCPHLAQINDVTASTDGCEECLQMGESWVELRLCLMCGHVGCCDNSKNRHASQHYHATKHPLVHPYGTFGEWLWCYIEEKLMFPY